MEELPNVHEATQFLEDVVAPHYRTMAEFEGWVKDYEGPFKSYLFKVL